MDWGNTRPHKQWSTLLAGFWARESFIEHRKQQSRDRAKLASVAYLTLFRKIKEPGSTESRIG